MKNELGEAPGSPEAEKAPFQSASLADGLRLAAQRLAHIDAPRITAEALLAHILNLTRTQLLARLEQPLPPELAAPFDRLVARAAEGEPLAYLTGHREFYGLDFWVDARVLVPRPETELLVELALKNFFRRALEVGTGSGALAVTLAVKRPSARLVATDLSADALAVARLNAARHAVADRIAFVQGDLLSSFLVQPSSFGVHSFDLLVANLPYIPSAKLRQLPVVKHEPRLALDGGPDGLELFRRLLAEARRVMAPGGRLLLEIEDTNGPAALKLAQAAFPAAQTKLHPDLAGLDRGLEIILGA